MDNSDRLFQLFDQVRGLPSASERERFLMQRCGDDAALREEVLSLVQASENAGEFLNDTLVPPDLAPAEKPGDRIGRYRLGPLIGEGGCGVVYLAEQEEPVRRQVGLAYSVAFSPDSRLLLVATSDHRAMGWDLATRTSVFTLDSPRVPGFSALAFDPEGRWIASGGTDCQVQLWDARTHKRLKSFRGHKSYVVRLRFVVGPEGPRLISGARDGAIRIWDLRPFLPPDP